MESARPAEAETSAEDKRPDSIRGWLAAHHLAREIPAYTCSRSKRFAVSRLLALLHDLLRGCR